MQPKTLLSIFKHLPKLGFILPILGCVCIAGCMNGPARPDTNLYQIIVAPEGDEAFGHNVAKDYDDNGNLIPGSKPVVVPLKSLGDLRGWYCTDKTGFKHLKVFEGDVRNYAKDHCQ